MWSKSNNIMYTQSLIYIPQNICKSGNMFYRYYSQIGSISQATYHQISQYRMAPAWNYGFLKNMNLFNYESCSTWHKPLCSQKYVNKYSLSIM